MKETQIREIFENLMYKISNNLIEISENIVQCEDIDKELFNGKLKSYKNVTANDIAVAAAKIAYVCYGEVYLGLKFDFTQKHEN